MADDDANSVQGAVATAAASTIANVVEKIAFAVGGVYFAERTARAKAAGALIELEEAEKRRSRERDLQRQVALDKVKDEAQVKLYQAVADAAVENQLQRLRNLTQTARIAVEISHEAGDAEALDPPADDWIQRWRSYAEEISDERVQRIWAHILRSASVPDSQRPSLLALDALRYFSAKTAEAFLVIARRLAFSDRMFSDELNALQPPGLDLHTECGRLQDMRILTTVENPSKFVHVFGLTVSTLETVFNISGGPTSLGLSTTGKELAAALLPQWSERQKHYIFMSQKERLPDEIAHFEPTDKNVLEGIFQNIAAALHTRYIDGTNWISIRHFRDDDATILDVSRSSQPPYRPTGQYKKSYAANNLSAVEISCVGVFVAELLRKDPDLLPVED